VCVCNRGSCDGVGVCVCRVCVCVCMCIWKALIMEWAAHIVALGMLQCIAVCCSVLQCVCDAPCCSVLQCVL